jgi:hypothetical protein
LKVCGATAADVAALRRSQAASDVYSPVSGTVVETNGALADAPATARAPKPPKQRARQPALGVAASTSQPQALTRCPLSFPAGEQQPLRRRLDDEGQAVQPGGCAARDAFACAWFALRTLFSTLTQSCNACVSAEVQKLMDAKKYSAHCEAGGH